MRLLALGAFCPWNRAQPRLRVLFRLNAPFGARRFLTGFQGVHDQYVLVMS